MSAEVPVEGSGPRTFDKGLKADAIGFVDSLVIGLASTAPAYSLAAVIGSVVVIGGVQAPAVLLASFVPMVLIASAFYYMNKVDTDAGTTFSWVTRGLGPFPGWMGGWAICTTGILVVGSLADVGARYFYVLVGWDSAAEEKWAVMALAIVAVGVLTLICVLGTELSAKLQNAMILIQVGSLLLFAAVAIIKVYGDDAPSGSIEPSLSWLNPFEIDSSASLTAGLLIGVFIYWGWESSVNLAEETTRSGARSGQGRGPVDRDPARDLRVGRDRGRGIRGPRDAGGVRRRRERVRDARAPTCLGRHGTSSWCCPSSPRRWPRRRPPSSPPPAPPSRWRGPTRCPQALGRVHRRYYDARTSRPG